MSQSKTEEFPKDRPSISTDKGQVIIQGPLPQIVKFLEIKDDLCMPQEEKDYLLALKNENFERLRGLVSERPGKASKYSAKNKGGFITQAALEARLTSEAKTEGRSYVQGIANASALPDQVHLTSPAFVEDVANYSLTSNERGQQWKYALEIPFLNKGMEISGFAINYFRKPNNTFMFDITIIKNSCAHPTQRLTTYVASSELLNPIIRIDGATETNLVETVKTAIDSEYFLKYINIDRLCKGTEDSMYYLEDVINCFPKGNEPDFDKLKEIYYATKLDKIKGVASSMYQEMVAFAVQHPALTAGLIGLAVAACIVVTALTSGAAAVLFAGIGTAMGAGTGAGALVAGTAVAATAPGFFGVAATQAVVKRDAILKFAIEHPVITAGLVGLFIALAVVLTVLTSGAAAGLAGGLGYLMGGTLSGVGAVAAGTTVAAVVPGLAITGITAAYASRSCKSSLDKLKHEKDSEEQEKVDDAGEQPAPH